MPPIACKGKRIKVARFRIKYKDVFDMKQFYDDLHEWLKEHGWRDLEDNWEHYETFYLEKVDGGGFKEIICWWRPRKVPVNNPYYWFWLDFDFHCVGLKSTEVVKEGKKFKVHKGEVELYVTAWLDLDPEGRWEKNYFLKIFHQLFIQRIFRREIYEEHAKELYQEAYELQNWIKHWFKLKTYAPYEEKKIFPSSFAWPSHLKE